MIENDYDLDILKSTARDIGAIVTKYEQIAVLTGEGFNIFRLLNRATDEVGLHSVLLAELLNPSGAHGLGDSCLKHFVDMIDFKDFDTKRVRSCGPKYIGRINEDYTEGGSIDIFILNDVGQAIAIENKIHSGEQKNQLTRYHHHCERFNGSDEKNARLIYLTLDGSEGTSFPNGKAGDYGLLSYKHDIIGWLELCRKEAATFPLVRETITQYIHLLQSLTGQSQNKLMAKEIDEYLQQSPGNLKAMMAIHEHAEGVRQKFVYRFGEMLREEYEMEPLHGFKLTVSKNFGKPGDGILLGNSYMPEIRIEVRLGSSLKDFFIVTSAPKSEEAFYKEKVGKYLEIAGPKKLADWKNGRIWVWHYDALDNYFNSTDKWSELINGKSVMTEPLLKILKDCIEAVVSAYKEARTMFPS